MGAFRLSPALHGLAVAFLLLTCSCLSAAAFSIHCGCEMDLQEPCVDVQLVCRSAFFTVRSEFDLPSDYSGATVRWYAGTSIATGAPMPFNPSNLTPSNSRQSRPYSLGSCTNRATAAACIESQVAVDLSLIPDGAPDGTGFIRVESLSAEVIQSGVVNPAGPAKFSWFDPDGFTGGAPGPEREQPSNMAPDRAPAAPTSTCLPSGTYTPPGLSSDPLIRWTSLVNRVARACANTNITISAGAIGFADWVVDMGYPPLQFLRPGVRLLTSAVYNPATLTGGIQIEFRGEMRDGGYCGIRMFHNNTMVQGLALSGGAQLCVASTAKTGVQILRSYFSMNATLKIDSGASVSVVQQNTCNNVADACMVNLGSIGWLNSNRYLSGGGAMENWGYIRTVWANQFGDQLLGSGPQAVGNLLCAKASAPFVNAATGNITYFARNRFAFSNGGLWSDGYIGPGVITAATANNVSLENNTFFSWQGAAAITIGPTGMVAGRTAGNTFSWGQGDGIYSYGVMMHRIEGNTFTDTFTTTAAIAIDTPGLTAELCLNGGQPKSPAVVPAIFRNTFTRFSGELCGAIYIGEDATVAGVKGFTDWELADVPGTPPSFMEAWNTISATGPNIPVAATPGTFPIQGIVYNTLTAGGNPELGGGGGSGVCNHGVVSYIARNNMTDLSVGPEGGVIWNAGSVGLTAFNRINGVLMSALEPGVEPGLEPVVGILSSTFFVANLLYAPATNPRRAVSKFIRNNIVLNVTSDTPGACLTVGMGGGVFAFQNNTCNIVTQGTLEQPDPTQPIALPPANQYIVVESEPTEPIPPEPPCPAFEFCPPEPVELVPSGLLCTARFNTRNNAAITATPGGQRTEGLGAFGGECPMDPVVGLFDADIIAYGGF